MGDVAHARSEDTVGLLIPIGILLIVYLGTGIIYILIPIFVLGVILISTVLSNNKIKKTTSLSSTGESAATSYTSVRPVYEQWRRKEDGISLGTLIPIVVLGWLYFKNMLNWPLLIPIFVLLMVFVGDLINDKYQSKKIHAVLDSSQGRTLSEIANDAGVPEDRAILQVVHGKRHGRSDIWFDPNSGTVVDGPARPYSESSTKTPCVYGGFALHDEDRFCPYCGAPIRID